MGNAPRCPRCGSANTRKSDDRLLKGGLSFLGDVAIGIGLGKLGMADYAVDNAENLTLSQYVDDEFQCGDCGYVWKPGNINGAVTEVWVNHNVENDGEIGMEIHAKFEVNGMLNRQGRIQAFFYHRNGEQLIDTNGNYCCEDGTVTCGEFFQPQYDNTIFNDFPLFIPYKELHLGNSCTILCDVYISDGNNWIAKSSQLNIDYQKNEQEEIDNQEFQLFNDEFNQFFENENSILSSSNSLRNYMNKLDGIIKSNIGNTIVKSEYRFLQAFACSEYLYYIDASDADIAKLGERKIDSAIQCNNDDEYKVLKQVLRSYYLDFEAPDILSIQKKYDQKCPNIQGLQNTLIKREYLDQVYRFSRFCSLLETFLKLDEKGRCDQALDALNLMLKLDTPNAYITASVYLYECHWAIEKYKAFWDEDKAFRYAKQGADYAIDFMKSNYSPDGQLSKDWMELVVGTASRYHDGIGIEVDLSEAEKYLMIGVGHGNEECKKLLKELYESPSTNVANSTEESKGTWYSADGVSADIMNIVNNNKWYFHELTQKYDFCFFLLEKESYSDVVENVKSLLDTFPLGKEEKPLYLCGFFYDENDENSNSSWFLITNSSIYCDSYEELVFDWNEVANITIENNILCINFDRDGVSYRWELLPKLVTGNPNAPLEQWRSILQSFVEVNKSDNPKSIGCQIGLTDSEQEYLDTLKESFEDGDITPRERRMLERIRVSLGISEERAKEIESLLSILKLTSDEKEYLEAYKDACEDGMVSDRQRRLLEKIRVMYGISEARAREIEKYN